MTQILGSGLNQKSSGCFTTKMATLGSVRAVLRSHSRVGLRRQELRRGITRNAARARGASLSPQSGARICGATIFQLTALTTCAVQAAPPSIASLLSVAPRALRRAESSCAACLRARCLERLSLHCVSKRVGTNIGVVFWPQSLGKL